MILTRACVLLVALVALPSDAAAKDVDPIKAGVGVRRLSRGNIEYTVYAPEKWRPRKPVPLMIHVLQERITPHQAIAAAYVLRETDDAVTRQGFVAIHCWVLLEAHNKENAMSTANVDVTRYQTLLERDGSLVLEVMDALAEEVPIRRDAVFLVGNRYAAEAALGLAVRHPDRFAGVVVKELECSLLQAGAGPGSEVWQILPKDEVLARAHRLPVALAYDPGEPNGEARARTAKRMQLLLDGKGFMRVTQVPGTPGDSYRQIVGPKACAWAVQVLAEQEVRSEKAAARDALLAEGTSYIGKGNLSSALKRYAKARALEVKHHLEPSCAELYGLLEARGRALIAEADGLSVPKKKSAYRKIGRLFKGTPLGDEVDAMLGRMR